MNFFNNILGLIISLSFGLNIWAGQDSQLSQIDSSSGIEQVDKPEYSGCIYDMRKNWFAVGWHKDLKNAFIVSGQLRYPRGSLFKSVEICFGGKKRSFVFKIETPELNYYLFPSSTCQFQFSLMKTNTQDYYLYILLSQKSYFTSGQEFEAVFEKAIKCAEPAFGLLDLFYSHLLDAKNDRMSECVKNVFFSKISIYDDALRLDNNHFEFALSYLQELSLVRKIFLDKDFSDENKFAVDKLLRECLCCLNKYFDNAEGNISQKDLRDFYVRLYSYRNKLIKQPGILTGEAEVEFTKVIEKVYSKINILGKVWMIHQSHPWTAFGGYFATALISSALYKIKSDREFRSAASVLKNELGLDFSDNKKGFDYFNKEFKAVMGRFTVPVIITLEDASSLFTACFEKRMQLLDTFLGKERVEKNMRFLNVFYLNFFPSHSQESFSKFKAFILKQKFNAEVQIIVNHKRPNRPTTRTDFFEVLPYKSVFESISYDSDNRQIMVNWPPDWHIKFTMLLMDQNLKILNNPLSSPADNIDE